VRPLLAVAESPRARERRDGFIEEWRSEGHDTPSVIDVPLPTRFGHARLVWRQVMKESPLPDVVVCGSDVLAQGVIVEAQAAGIRVPDQVAVMGFGNMAIAGDMRPSITTVDVDGARIGREAVAVLRRRAAGERISPRVIDVGFRLIARESA
jgi:LacI family gluconate utilization system Gnt-I transcriptional repressor